MTIEIPIDDLTMHRWKFWFSDFTLYVDLFQILKRPTKRHKWKIDQSYNRIDGRHSSISIEDVPLTEEIREKILALVTGRLKISKWKYGETR